MKKFNLFAGAAVLAVVGLLGAYRLAGAYSIHTGDNVSLSQRKVINDTVYAAGRSVDINSEVYGDVFCAGQDINISGIVHGDVICAGQTVNISGTVDGDVRLAGQDVNLGARVGGNATVGGQSFVLQSNGSVGGDVTSGAQNATLNGKIGRDMVIGSGNVTINSVVGRNIKAQAGQMKLGSGANVGGNIDITSRNHVTKDKGAVVSGKISRTVPKNETKPKHGAIFGFGIIWFIYWFLAMLVTALVLTLLFPRLFKSVTDRGLPGPWKALGVGFAASILVPVIIVLIAASLIGLPLAILLGLGWLVTLLLSGPVFAFYIGRLVFGNTFRPLLAMLVGAAILITLYFIPIFGILAVLAALWIGTGMLLMEIFRTTPKPDYSSYTDK